MKIIINNLREYLLALIRSSNVVGNIYSYITLFYSFKLVKNINSYATLTLLCNAIRRIPDLEKTHKCFELIKKIIQDQCCKDGKLLPIEQNKLLVEFYKSRDFTKASRVFAAEPEIDRLHLRHYRNDSDSSRQGNMIVLKKPVIKTGEKGVIVLNYSPTFEQFPAVYNLISITKEYRIVFEPSSYRNIESSLFLYLGLGQTNVFQAAQSDDKTVLERLCSSFKIIELGAGDWTNIEAFKPLPGDKVYDVVMLASWMKLKRHSVLFDALSKLKDRGRKLRVALIGYPMDMTKCNIIDIAKQYGVDSFCDIFERIPPAEVAKIVSASRMAVHLSKAEGTNKASYEALFCNVPLIVYKHNMGFRNDFINEHTGMLADDNELADAIEFILANQDRFSPRKWVLKYSGHLNATRILNDALKEVALELGEPWTINIVPKKNGPNFLYAEDEDRIDMEPAYSELRKHLL